MTSEEKLRQAGLDADERDNILNMARSSAEIFAHTLPVHQMTEDELWDRKLDYHNGYIDAMADAMSLVLNNIRQE
jgi:hypothetical protein